MYISLIIGEQMSKIAIHETAFVTSHFRAGNEPVSRDPYAHLWPGPMTIDHAEKYVNSVSQYEPIAHCLRNRFFLEALERLNRDEGINTLLNFGCGFSMYPYLLPDTMEFYEVDKSEVLGYKEARIKAWQEAGKLPLRTVNYLAFDFIRDDYAEIMHWLSPKIGGDKSIILLEGVLFFLNRKICDKLFNLFEKLQVPGSYTGSVSFRTSLVNSSVFKRLIDYVNQGLSTEGEFEFFTVDDAYYQNLKGYEVDLHKDSHSLAREYIPHVRWEKEKVLNEQMYLLKRN